MKHFKTLFTLSLLCALGMILLALGRNSLAQEHIGTVSQPLVGGTVIDAATQEKFTLLTLSSGCSASLLRNNWAVTAAHCVDVTDAAGNFTPDPNRPGQNMLRPLAGMTLSAAWKTPQTQNVVQIATFRPYDVAIVRVANPFKINGSTTGFSRLIFQDGQFPYFGEPVGADLLVFGRGINQFAQGAGATAIPSQSDGQYRIGYAKATRNEDNRYWYPSENGQMIAGGDSGGPSFARGLSGYALVGVHSLAKTQLVPGKTKDPANPWQWVAATPEAADAPLAPVVDEMNTIMGALPPSGLGDPPAPTGNVGSFGGGHAQTPSPIGDGQITGAIRWKKAYGQPNVGRTYRPPIIAPRGVDGTVAAVIQPFHPYARAFKIRAIAQAGRGEIWEVGRLQSATLDESQPASDNYVLRYSITNLPLDVPIKVEVSLDQSVAWQGDVGAQQRIVGPDNWTGMITLRRGLQIGTATATSVNPKGIGIAGALKAAQNAKEGATTPGDKVALNPQPLPPGDTPKFNARIGSLVRPGDKVALNPQLLPPRTMSGTIVGGLDKNATVSAIGKGSNNAAVIAAQLPKIKRDNPTGRMLVSDIDFDMGLLTGPR